MLFDAPPWRNSTPEADKGTRGPWRSSASEAKKSMRGATVADLQPISLVFHEDGGEILAINKHHE